MRGWSPQRQAAMGGVVFVLLLLVASFIPGAPPQFDDSPDKILKYFVDNDQAILISGLLQWTALPFFIWFAVGLVGVLRRSGQSGLAQIAFGGAVATVAVVAVGNGMNTALVRVSQSTADLRLVQAGYMTVDFIYQAFYFTAIALLVAASVAGLRGTLPRWHAWLGSVVAVLMLIAGLSIKASGFFSPGNLMGLFGFLAFLVWILGTCVVLWKMESDEIPAPASAAA